ncbi:hypothetical protein BN2364_3016 [Alloalcanivorax xenomutans]|uniref:hypothetical protein n=1 Tax=Alloalcanivorax xenomutans TaxID=1094342 RepID=UPI0006D5C1FC|nr:hypothetical protein [Alloalcanivorax xenomutans]PHS60714.1 MAG: hypothetical protein COB00_14840 [Alcanivorax sp.]CUR47457.1 hypothetical protein BN2364_3016 [Alloalcanivorax xenomutans]
MIRNNQGFFVAQGLKEELFLMKAFINQQEKQINNYIRDIDDCVETAEAEEWYETSDGQAEKVLVNIKHIEGVSEDDYDFKAIFTEVMPLYQRQAMLVAVWGRLECKLDNIAHHLATIRNIKIKSKSKGLSDFMHLINEIERLGVKIRDSKECSLAVDTLNEEVREIRNAWVHNGGRATKKRVRIIVKSSQHLRFESEKINISKEYMLFVIGQMSKISKKILSEFIAKKIS